MSILSEVWKEEIENGIITTTMMNEALLFVTHKAKMHKEAGEEEIARVYYDKKTKLLSYLTPHYIHIKHLGYENGKRIYEKMANLLLK